MGGWVGGRVGGTYRSGGVESVNEADVVGHVGGKILHKKSVFLAPVLLGKEGGWVGG